MENVVGENGMGFFILIFLVGLSLKESFHWRFNYYLEDLK
jgi:hypothetical protein